MEREPINERILQMINGDEEMVILGLKLLFDKGQEWLIKNIPAFGARLEQEEMAKLIKVTANSVFVKRGNIACRLCDSILDFRYIHDFPLANEFTEI